MVPRESGGKQRHCSDLEGKESQGRTKACARVCCSSSRFCRRGRSRPAAGRGCRRGAPRCHATAAPGQHCRGRCARAKAPAAGTAVEGAAAPGAAVSGQRIAFGRPGPARDQPRRAAPAPHSYNAHGLRDAFGCERRRKCCGIRHETGGADCRRSETRCATLRVHAGFEERDVVTHI